MKQSLFNFLFVSEAVSATLASMVGLMVAAIIMLSSAQAFAQTFSQSVPSEVKAKIQADMAFVQGIQSDNGAAAETQIFQQIFGDKLNGPNLTNFFATRILNFDMSDCGGGGSVAACASPRHTMYITQNYVTFDIPQIYRISVIFHESRHTEAAHRGWPHAICPTPFKDAAGNDIKGIVSGSLMAGLDACDNTELGAYGLQAELLKNIEFACSNCTDKMKMDGQIFGDDTVKRIIGPAAAVLKKDVRIQ